MKTTIFALLALVALLIPSTMNGQNEMNEQNTVLMLVENDPTVSFRLWFKAGAQNDPAGKEGLAALTAQMLADASTEKNSYEQILEKLYPLAAGYNASSSMEMTVFTGRTHKDNLKEYYPLFMDALLAPAFKQEDLDRIKDQTLNYLENTLRYASDEELGKAVLHNTIYAGTPYGHINAGLIESVRGITIDDIRNFYKQYFTRDNVVIGLAGGYDAALVKTLEEDVRRLPAARPPAVAKPTPTPLKGVSVTIIEKDAASTAISMGFPMDLLRGTREWYALAIANSWLGEHRNSSSHLYQVIREERGLNYGDYSYIEHYPNGGQRSMPPQNVGRRQHLFEIWIRPVPNETRHFAMRAALREFRNLVDNGMSEADFTLTKSFLSKYVLHYASTTMERLAYALDDKFYGIDGSHLEMFRRLMNEITREEVNAAIKKHWQYENMQIAVITKDAQAFKDALVSDAPSPITYSSPKPESILNEDKEIITFPLNIKAENVKIIPVTELFVKK